MQRCMLHGDYLQSTGKSQRADSALNCEEHLRRRKRIMQLVRLGRKFLPREPVFHSGQRRSKPSRWNSCRWRSLWWFSEVCSKAADEVPTYLPSTNRSRSPSHPKCACEIASVMDTDVVVLSPTVTCPTAPDLNFCQRWSQTNVERVCRPGHVYRSMAYVPVLGCATSNLLTYRLNAVRVEPFSVAEDAMLTTRQ